MTDDESPTVVGKGVVMNAPIGRISFLRLIISTAVMAILALPAAAESYASSQAGSEAGFYAGWPIIEPFYPWWYNRPIVNVPPMQQIPIQPSEFNIYGSDVIPRQTGYARVIPYGGYNQYPSSYQYPGGYPGGYQYPTYNEF